MNSDDETDCSIASIKLKLRRMTCSTSDLEFLWRRYAKNTSRTQKYEKWESEKWILTNDLWWRRNLCQCVERVKTTKCHKLLAGKGHRMEEILHIGGCDKTGEHNNWTRVKLSWWQGMAEHPRGSNPPMSCKHWGRISEFGRVWNFVTKRLNGPY